MLQLTGFQGLLEKKDFLIGLEMLETGQSVETDTGEAVYLYG